jgi:hypothetical protein
MDTTHSYTSKSRVHDHFEYEEGQTLTDYMDPERIEQAFLNEKHTVRNLRLVTLGGLMLLLGATGVLYSLFVL